MNASAQTSPMPTGPVLSPEELRKTDAWWRAANYLNVGQIYLSANPLLRDKLSVEHIKPRLLGHWGTKYDKSANSDKYWKILLKRQSIQSLPIRERVRMLRAAGDSLKDISKSVGVSLSTVNRILRTGR